MNDLAGTVLAIACIIIVFGAIYKIVQRAFCWPRSDNDDTTTTTETNCIISIPARDDFSADQRNDITEQILEELYQEKCTMSVQPDEIEFVKQNVERFVSRGIQKVAESETYQNSIRTVDRKGLIQFTEHFREDRLLKTGSFYEGTKNNYPDEFDFIFILAECPFMDNILLKDLTSNFADLFHEQFKRVLSGLSLEFGEVFEQCSYTGLHGPASKIKLVFKESTNLRVRTIYVDISAASRVCLGESLPEEMKICYDEWKAMLLKTGSFLVIKVYKTDHPKHETDVKFTITETEQYFVRREMSENHRKVYRLLKYISNGNHDGNELLKKLIRRPDNTEFVKLVFCLGRRHAYPKIVYDLPSYAIKTLVFHHVHHCQNAENGITECLTEVLRSLMTAFNVNIDNCENKNRLTVSVKTMLGQPLEISDEYTAAKRIRKKISRLSETVANVEQTKEAKRSDLNDQIPFTYKTLNTVQYVLDLKKRMIKIRRIIAVVLVVLFILVLGISIALGVLANKTGQVCDTNSDNKTIDIQFCCAGTKYRSDIWRNMTCLKSNMFSGHTDDAAGSSLVELKQAFACIPLTVVQNSDTTDDNDGIDYASTRVTLCEVNETKNTEICLHCNAPLQDSGYTESLPRSEIQEPALYTCVAPCHLKTLYHQVNAFLKTKAHMLEEVYYYSKTDKICRTENITVNPLQTEENTARENRTEISSGNATNSSSYQPSDECANYGRIFAHIWWSFVSFAAFIFLTPEVIKRIIICYISGHT